MCGIFGFWLNRPLTEQDIELGRAASRLLSHRGPDAGGEWFDVEGGVYFGHRRLAIIDLSAGGAQPMRRSHSIVSYNGELYNFAEIKRELLQQGVAFSSDSDTEVLLAAWNTWGPACLERFDGMFAFALYDGVRLHLVTDPFGEKPIYVANAADGVYFSSEPGVLIDLLKLDFRPSEEEIRQFLALGFILPPGTGYSDLGWMPAATMRSYEAPGRFSQQVYWMPPQSEDGKQTVEEADIDRLRDVLVESLHRRVRADVPVGLFLSSGTDSALVAALAVRELGVSLRSLTVSFADGVDEASGARAIAGHLNLPHVILDSREEDTWRNLPQALANLYRVPNDNVTALSILQMSHLARQEFTVALGGVGGDEAFYGYNKYAFLARYRFAYRLPPALIGLLTPLLRRHPRLSTMERMLRGSRSERFLTLKNAELGRLMAAGAFRPPHLPSFADNGVDMLGAVRRFDLLYTLPASYVAAVDRGSMRASMEVRTPYLSRAVFEFSARFHPLTMIRKGQKAVLKRLLRRYLPAELVYTPKRGFVFPLRRYMAITTDQPSTSVVAAPAMADLWRRREENGADVLVLRAQVLNRFMQS